MTLHLERNSYQLEDRRLLVHMVSCLWPKPAPSSPRQSAKIAVLQTTGNDSMKKYSRCHKTKHLNRSETTVNTSPQRWPQKTFRRLRAQLRRNASSEEYSRTRCLRLFLKRIVKDKGWRYPIPLEMDAPRIQFLTDLVEAI